MEAGEEVGLDVFDEEIGLGAAGGDGDLGLIAGAIGCGEVGGLGAGFLEDGLSSTAEGRRRLPEAAIGFGWSRRRKKFKKCTFLRATDRVGCRPRQFRQLRGCFTLLPNSFRPLPGGVVNLVWPLSCQAGSSSPCRAGECRLEAHQPGYKFGAQTPSSALSNPRLRLRYSAFGNRQSAII